MKFIESEIHSAVESVSAERADGQDDHQDTLWLYWEAPLIRGEEEGGLLGSERMVVVIVMMMIKIMVTMMGRNDAIKCKLSDRVLRPAQGLEHNIWWRNEYKYKYNQSTNTSTNTVWSCLMHVLWCLVVSMYIYIYSL